MKSGPQEGPRLVNLVADLIAQSHDFGGELLSATWNWNISRDLFLETKLAQHESDENKFLSVGDGSVESAIAVKQQDPRYPGNAAGGPILAGKQLPRLL